jgi:class 3 adenylate cyclase
VETQTGYASNGGVHLAYRVEGSGPDLLVIAGTLISLDVLDEQPRAAAYLRRLTSFCRTIRYDLRGVGRSDPVSLGTDLNVDDMVADARAVLDAVGTEQVAVLAEGGGLSTVALRLAVTEPTRVRALVLVNTTARLLEDIDYPGVPASLVDDYLHDNIDPANDWRHPDADDEDGGEVATLLPSLAADKAFRTWWDQAGQRSASPGTARAVLGAVLRCDSRLLLSEICGPALVLHAREGRITPVEQGRYVADHIAGARFVELPGGDQVVWATNADPLLDQVEEFLTGRRTGRVERVLTTVLFTDIVDSTQTAAVLGDRAWRDRLEIHDALVRRELARFGGREVNTTGDGFVASFDSPTQAVLAAASISRAAAEVGIDVRGGLHTGECERRGDDLAGIAVHLASRVAATAGAREVLVSRTVRDLVSGSDLRFEGRGEHDLKGVPERWQLFALID